MASSLVHFPADFPKCPAASNQILRGNMTILCHNFGAVIKTGSANENKTLPKALRTQALTALTSSFGLIWWVRFGMFGSVGLLG